MVESPPNARATGSRHSISGIARPRTASGIQRSSTPTPLAAPGDFSASPESRRYRILGVLGKGGFGTVYHARLEGPEGFVKEVAIKILSDRDPGQETLSRFRDEARILGRVRDRAIVSVEPPSQLDGRWAVVMEYVDGLDCRRLLKDHGPLPPLVALGIVEEIARTLHNLWHHPGEDGRPIQLLHRDLKPSNIQVTPSGAVKLLDFGVARAEIGREWNTTNHIAGTLGYIAPERLRGVEAPDGDVYSLGVVLEELITGKRPSAMDDGAPTWDPVLELARQMRAPDPTMRPPAAEVERRCHALQITLPGPRLREWAQAEVRHGPHQAGDDPLVGQTLSETFARLSQTSGAVPLLPPADRPGGVLTGIALAGFLSIVSIVAVLLFGAGAIGVWWWTRPAPITVAPVLEAPSPGAPQAPEPIVADPGVAEPGVAEPVVTEPGVAEPVVAEPVAEPVVRPTRPRPPAAPTGRVSQQGADSIELVGEAGRFGVGVVPAGEYRILASFGGAAVPAGTIVVGDGDRVTLRCDGRFQRCVRP